MLYQGYRVERFAPSRRLTVDWLVLGERRHMIHGLVEVDVHGTRARLRERGFSFTAWVLSCVARAVAAHPQVQACRDWRGRLVIFEDVDATVLVEVEHEGGKLAMAHVIHEANRRPLEELSAQLRTVKRQPSKSSQGDKLGWMSLWMWVPGVLRRLVYRSMLIDPHRRRRMVGTISVTAVGMFGASGFGIAAPTAFPLQVVVGGLVTRPVWDGERFAPREHLQLTLSVDHDLVDGAPAARFGAHLIGLLKEGALPE